LLQFSGRGKVAKIAAMKPRRSRGLSVCSASLASLLASAGAAAGEDEPADELIDRILRGELHVDEVSARPDIVLIQDGVAMKGLRKPRDTTTDKLRASDRQVILLRRLWKRELNAIEEGPPIKQWRVPPDLAPTSGTDGD
jgi:5,5'-dehydrodivanillate O-demethylase